MRSRSWSRGDARYIQRVEPVLQELEAATEDAAGALGATRVGKLRMTASVAFGHRCIVPLLPQFRRKFPGLQLEMILTSSNLDLVGEGIDVAIRLGPSLSGDLVGAKLFETRYRVCASAAYLRKTPGLKKPADLSVVSSLRFTYPDFRSRWLFRNSRGVVSEVPVNGDILISNAMALRE